MCNRDKSRHLSQVGTAEDKDTSHAYATLWCRTATCTGKLQPLSGNGQPLEGQHLKAKQNNMIVHTLSTSCGGSYCVTGVIQTVPVTFVLDTGAAVSLIRENIWVRISRAASVRLPELQPWKSKRLVGVNGSPLSVRGFGKVQVFLDGRNTLAEVTLLVTNDLTIQKAILGLDFVEMHMCD